MEVEGLMKLWLEVAGQMGRGRVVVLVQVGCFVAGDVVDLGVVLFVVWK